MGSNSLDTSLFSKLKTTISGRVPAGFAQPGSATAKSCGAGASCSEVLDAAGFFLGLLIGTAAGAAAAGAAFLDVLAFLDPLGRVAVGAGAGAAAKAASAVVFCFLRGVSCAPSSSEESSQTLASAYVCHSERGRGTVTATVTVTIMIWVTVTFGTKCLADSLAARLLQIRRRRDQRRRGFVPWCRRRRAGSHTS